MALRKLHHSMPKWRNGRRAGLKNRWGQPHVSSSLTFGTKFHLVKSLILRGIHGRYRYWGHQRELTLEEGRELFDKQARRYLNMSGEEFINKWEAGEFDDDPDRPEVMEVVMLLPFVCDGRENS
jgi:hypothetical protein